MQVTGKVQDIKSRTTKFGDMFDIVVDGASYGAGKYAPRGVVAGDFVTFEVEVNGNYKNVKRNTLSKVANPSTEQVAASAKATTVNKANDDARQDIISKQAALNTAVAFVNVLLSNGAVPLPSKGADKAGAVEAMLMKYAAQFFGLSTGKKLDIPDTGAKSSRAAKEEADEDEFPDDSIPF